MIGKEINLLRNYPQSSRNLNERLQKKTEENRKIAREFGKEFFDGDRMCGYGGFSYNPKFWKSVIPDFKKYWNLSSNNSILDVGCGKGFMLFDIINQIPGIKIKGIDISKYAIKNCKKEVKEFLEVGNAKQLPFEDNSFDIVISINTIHNLDEKECSIALKEISRVSKHHAFVTVDAYRNEEEKKKMFAWNLTAKTIKSVRDWKIFFEKNKYKGDFYWFIP